MKVGVLNESEPRSQQSAGVELTNVTVTSVRWIRNQESGFDELVRESDGQVLDRRPSKKGGQSRMRISAEERAREHFGEKHGNVTIGKFTRKHQSTGTAMVNASCECGKDFEVMLSAVLDDNRKYCDTRTCPIAAKDRQNARNLIVSDDKPTESESKVIKRRSG